MAAREIEAGKTETDVCAVTKKNMPAPVSQTADGRGAQIWPRATHHSPRDQWLCR